jgi:hypothetical protein
VFLKYLFCIDAIAADYLAIVGTVRVLARSPRGAARLISGSHIFLLIFAQRAAAALL